MEAPPDEKAPPLAGNDALNISHEMDEEATGRLLFRERIAAALLPLASERFQAEIEHAEAEARAEELLKKRLAEREGK